MASAIQGPGLLGSQNTHAPQFPIGHNAISYANGPNKSPNAGGLTFSAFAGPMPMGPDGSPALTREQEQLLYFGPPRTENRQDPYAYYPDDFKILPWAWRGQNTYLTEIIRRTVTSAEDVWIREIFPVIPYQGGTTVILEQIIFDDAKLDQVPETGVSRTLTQRYQQKRQSIGRYGKSFHMENGFLMTPEGKRDFFQSLATISNAVIYELIAAVVFAVLTSAKIATNEFEAYGIPYSRPTLRQVFEWEAMTFGILNLKPHGFRIACQKAIEVGQRNQVSFNTLILSAGLKFRYKLEHGEETTFSIAGERGPGLLNSKEGPLGSIASQNGFMVVESARLPLAENDVPEDPLIRPRAYGEYLQYCTQWFKHVNPAAWKTIYGTIVVMDNDSDTFANITLEQMFENMGLFQKGADGKPSGALTEFGEAFFGPYSTFADYLKRSKQLKLFQACLEERIAAGNLAAAVMNVPFFSGSSSGAPTETAAYDNDTADRYWQRLDHKEEGLSQGDKDVYNNAVRTYPEMRTAIGGQFSILLGMAYVSKCHRDFYKGLTAGEEALAQAKATDLEDMDSATYKAARSRMAKCIANLVKADPIKVLENEAARTAFARAVRNGSKNLFLNPSLVLGLGNALPDSPNLGVGVDPLVAKILNMRPSDLTGDLFQLFLDHDVWWPFNYLLPRPCISFDTGTLIFMKRGSETGNALYNFADLTLGVDATRKMILGNFTAYLGAFTKKPENIYHFHNAALMQYNGGGGVKLMDVADAQRVESLKNGNGPFPDIYPLVLPANEVISAPVIDLTGNFPATMMTEGSENPHYSTAHLMSERFGWRSPINYFDGMTHDFHAIEPHNTKVYRASMYLASVNADGTGYNPVGRRITGQGPCSVIYPGVNADRCGIGRNSCVVDAFRTDGATEASIC